jgi:hypothetical protein
MNTIQVPIKVDDEGLEEILFSAFCSAKYWLYDENIVYLEKFTYKFKVPITDDDSELEEYTLDKDKLLKGLTQYISEYGIASLEDGKINTRVLDNCDCELILQYALFKEQVFG